MEPILVTGGAGFIGANFVHRWRRTHPSVPVVVLDALTYAADAGEIRGLEGVELVEGDIQDRALVSSLLEERGIRTLVHFAAESHVDRSITGPGAFMRTNVMGTFALLEAARGAWAGDRSARFLHVSTDEVFGALGPAGSFSEATPYDPRSPYSASKAASDHLVRAYHHTYGLPVVVTNCSNNYGPRQHEEKLIPLALRRLFDRQPIPVYGQGQNVRDWIFVDDHCAALERALEAGTVGETYLVGAGNERRNLDLVELLCDLSDQALGRPAGSGRELITFVEDRPGHDFRYAIDATKARRALDWLPEVGLEEGLALTVAWYHARWSGARRP